MIASLCSASLNDVKSCFAHFLNHHINTKPTLGSNFANRKKIILRSEINILFWAECEINNILRTGGEINDLFC